MDLKYYSSVIFAVTFVPSSVVFIAGFIIWRCYPQSQKLLLIVMKNIVAENNIEGKPTYLVCKRKLPRSSNNRFMLSSLFIISVCVQCFFQLAIVELIYKCINQSDLDCFKKKDDVKLSDTFAYDESPVSCSSISTDDFVTCYRITVFDPERAFIAASATYLLFKMLNFFLFIVAITMLSVAKKWKIKGVWCFKYGLSITILMVIFIPFSLRIYLDEVESAFRRVSYTVLAQLILLVLVVIYFLAGLPWEEFSENEKYYEDASLPRNDSNREMSNRNDVGNA